MIFLYKVCDGTSTWMRSGTGGGCVDVCLVNVITLVADLNIYSQKEYLKKKEEEEVEKEADKEKDENTEPDDCEC